jgi:hypothetical protein
MRVDAIDPQSGDEHALGTLGDLNRTNLFGWLALDATHDVVYALGTAAIESDDLNVYALDLASGSSSSVPVDREPWVLAGLRQPASLVAVRWNGKAEVVALIDTKTGQVQEQGVLGDLAIWPGHPVYVAESDSLYAIGLNADNASYLYRFELTKAVTSQLPVEQDYILVKR